MTNYQCTNCNKTFIHPAKHITTLLSVKMTVPEPNITTSDKMEYNPTTITNNEATETHVCPFCQSKEYTEFVEPAEEISSVKSVDLAQVDDYLKLGYKVKELYAKTATLVKMETAPKDANLTLKDVIKAGIEQAKQEAPQ